MMKAVKSTGTRGLLLAITVIAASGSLMSAVNAQNAHRPSPQTGKQLALRTCDICHVVARDQTDQPMMINAPTFFHIANQTDATAVALEAFLAHPHALSRMPYPELTADQIADVSAYILSLRRR